jgi:hypothetical protein
MRTAIKEEDRSSEVPESLARPGRFRRPGWAIDSALASSSQVACFGWVLGARERGFDERRRYTSSDAASNQGGFDRWQGALHVTDAAASSNVPPVRACNAASLGVCSNNALEQSAAMQLR